MENILDLKKKIELIIYGYGELHTSNVYYSLCELAYLKKYIDKNNIILNQDILINLLNDLSNNKGLISDVAKDLYNSLMFVKNFNNIVEFIKSLSDDNIREIMINDSILDDGYKKNEFTTPSEITYFINKFYRLESSFDIMDACSGIGGYLVNTSTMYKLNSLTGVDINKQATLISKIRLEVLGNNSVSIINSDFITYDDLQHYDIIFSNYPISIRLDSSKLRYAENDNKLKFRWKYKNSTSSDWIFINKILSLLKEKGKAIVIMTSGALFKTADNQYKADLVDNGMVEKVIKLPERIFPGTSVSLNLVVFSENNKDVQFVDGSSAFLRKNRICNKLDVNKLIDIINNDRSLSVKVDNNKIKNNDYLLTVDKYIRTGKIIYHNPRKLSDFILDIFRGYQLTLNEEEKIDNPNGDYEILTISDIEDGTINTNLKKINSNNGKMDRYLIKDGDVIISSKGTRIKIVVADVGDKKIVANGNLIVLRLDITKINPYYLAMYLNSNDGNLILKSIQTGAVIISINPSKLSSITISTPDLEIQNKYAKLYQTKIKQVRLAKNHLSNLQSDVNNFYDNFSEEIFK